MSVTKTKNDMSIEQLRDEIDESDKAQELADGGMGYVRCVDCDDVDTVLALVSQLYEIYYLPGSNVTRYRLDVEIALESLMTAWDQFLG